MTLHGCPASGWWGVAVLGACLALPGSEEVGVAARAPPGSRVPRAPVPHTRRGDGRGWWRPPLTGVCPPPPLSSSPAPSPRRAPILRGGSSWR